MPIITKKDKLSISMTWSSSDDKNEVDISIQRDGDEDVTITMQSGKSSVVVGASCIKELYDFLIDRGIVEAPVCEVVSSPTSAIPSPFSAASSGRQEASDDVVGLLAEARRWSEASAASGRHVSHPLPVAHANESVYASPSMIAATGSAVMVQSRESSNVSPIARTSVPGITLPNESSAPEGGEEVIEMESVPPDIFGR